MYTQAVVIVGFTAILLPVAARIVSSPLALLLIFPVLLFIVAVAFLLLSIFFGHTLDTKYPRITTRLAHAASPFAFSSPAAWQATLTRSKWSQSSVQPQPALCPDAPLLSEALHDIITMVVRDFVQSWYEELSSSRSFPNAISSLLHASIGRLINRSRGIDLPALVVKRIIPKVTKHVEQFRHSEVALRGVGLERKLTQSEELDLLLASKYAGKGGGRLHPAIDNLSTTFTKQTEEAHLRAIVERAFPYVLPETEFKSKALRIVAREIVVCSILYPIMEMVSDPDFWNKSIDQVAGAAIHQQKLITKVRNVLEAQSPRTHNRVPTHPTSVSAERITIHTDIRQFESFLRSINRCSSLLDARRLKNDISGEIRRTRMLLANHEKDEWINGEKTEDIVAFLDRLYTAKRRAEERIVSLGGEDDGKQSSFQENHPKPGVALRDVLGNPSSLSYFMEFMDRRNRSLLVQFWLTVESFKNPLESIDSSSSGDDDELMQDLSASVTVQEDISMIDELYFLNPSPHPALAFLSQKYIDIIRDFSRGGSPPTPSSQRRVRRTVMLAQRQVEQEMEQDFEEFERSELWFRVIGDTNFGGQQGILPQQEEVDPTIPSPPPKHSHGLNVQTVPRSDSAHARTISSHSSHSSQIISPSHIPRATNIEVLMAPVPASASGSSRAPLFDDPEDEQQRAEERRMEAIHAALTDIMALEQEQSKPDNMRTASGLPKSSKARHSEGRRAMFEDDNDDYDDNDEEPGEMEESNGNRSSYQLAAPGDLQLSYEISRLGDNITNLQAQETMLNTLIKKAELTGDTQELRLLTRSKASMNRELRQLTFQKLQYEQQESANRLLSDRTKVAIVSSTVGDEEGKSVVRYLIEVQQLAPDGSFASGWVVARRYNEFLNMHNKLRERYGLVRGLDFPGKRLVTALSGSFVDTRKAALEKYLQNLIAISVVCESEDLCAFLSRNSPLTASGPETLPKSPNPFSGSDLVRNVYRSVAESIDDMFFGPSMLDVMIQRLTRQAAEFAGIVGSGVNDEDLVAQALNTSGKAAPEAALLHLSGDLKPLEGETSTSTFSAPICDLVLAVFELNRKNNWLRRQAIVIILQQVLGGTIERKFHENVKVLLDESRLLSFLQIFREGLWPGGKLKPPNAPRTAEEKSKTRDEANRKLSSLVPDLAANMIGRSNARRGARRIFAVLQNRRLNQHIAYLVLDEIVSALFPEASSKQD